MRWIEKIVLLCLFSGVSPHTSELAAQQLKFEHFDTREGLPSSEVYNVFQDHQGYIWAFTEYGIVRHNGKIFVPVCRNIPFAESVVYAVAASPAGTMYFANSEGHIYKISGDQAFLIAGIAPALLLMPGTPQFIYKLTIDDSENIHFSTLYHSYVFDQKLRKLRVSKPTAQSAGSLCFQETGNQFVINRPITDQKYAYQQLQVKNRRGEVTHVWKEQIDRVKRNHLVKTSFGLYFSTDKSITLLGKTGPEKTIDLHGIITITAAQNGHIWAATHTHGVYELDPNLQILHNYLQGTSVSAILFDNQSGVWISTIEKGIYYCRDQHHLFYDNLPDLAVQITMLKKSGEHLLIGTSTGKLFISEDHQLRNIPLDPSIYCVTDIVNWNGGYVLGSKITVTFLDSQFRQLQKQLWMPSLKIAGYAFATNGDTLVAIGSSFLNVITPDKVVFPDVIVHQKTRSILRRGNMYFIGTSKGVFTYENGQIAQPAYLAHLKKRHISCLRADRHGNTWICTKGYGMYMLDPDNQLTRLRCFPGTVINDLQFLQDDVVMLSTNKGIFINHVSHINRHSSWLQVWNEEALSAVMHQGKIYIATKEGLVSMAYDQLFEPEHTRFYLVSLTDKQGKLPTQNIHLEHWQNDLFFDFDFLAYKFDRKHLKYVLSGPSPDEAITDHTQLHFQNLSPGDYQLVVRPHVGFVSLDKQTITIRFSIAPAFWQTNFFMIAVFIVLALVVALITFFFFSRIRQKERARNENRKLLAQYKLTALKAQINPHFISNSLSAIQQLILQNETDKATQYLARYSLLMRHVLTYSDKNVTRLADEVQIIDLNVELEQLRFSNQFDYEKQIDPTIDLHETYVPPLITQPFIENAIWHGLLPLRATRAPKLTLKISRSAETLVISIIDNGVGRKKIPEQNHPERESRGISLILNRIENINRLYADEQAEIRYTDLVDEQQMPVGTRVDIVFPFKILIELYHEKDKERNY